MADFAVILPLAPGDVAIERASDLLDALFFYEPAAHVVVVDDDPADRGLAQRFGRGVVAVGNPRGGRGDGWRGGVCAGVLTGVRAVREHWDVSFALKIDDDALVIAPFARAIEAAAAADPRIGLLGAHERSPSWGWHIRKLGHPVSVWGIRTGRPRFTQALWGWRAAVRRIVRAAVDHGYRWGEHCQGGAYALTRGFIDALAGGGHLDDPLLFLESGLGEDVLSGLLCRASGFELRGQNRDGEPFGIRNEDLLDTPERMVERGFSLIHSVKKDRRFTEPQIRDFFRGRRAKSRPTG